MIIANNKITNMQHIEPSLWTPNTIVVKLRLKKHETPVFVIGHYSKPGCKTVLDQELEYFINVVRERHPQGRIIVGGDLNRSVKKMKSLCRKTNL